MEGSNEYKSQLGVGCSTTDDEFIDDYVPDVTDSCEILSVEEIVQKNISKNIRNLHTFLGYNNFITEKRDQNTNIISVAEKKTYCIGEAYIEQFFMLLDECRKENRMLHYSERQETASVGRSGIMIDFDRYQRARVAEVTDSHFEDLTRHIGKLLREFLDFGEYATKGKFTYRVFFIRKPEVVSVPGIPGDKLPMYKDGWHILIPEIQVSRGFKKFLSQELVSRDIIKDIFEDIDHIDDPSKMLDKMSACNPVHFLGNSKPGKPAYPLTHAYEVTMYTKCDDIDRKPLDVDMINSGLVKMSTDTVPINLTYELSLSFYAKTFAGKPTWLQKIQLDYRSHLETKIQLIVEKTSRNILDDDDILQAENSVDILTLGNAEANYLKRLLEIIDISYATEYEKWFKVICAIACTNQNYKPLAVWFSHRKPESWSPVEIDRVWAEATGGTYGGNPVTKGSIIHWAKTSSPQRFQEIKKENYFQALARSAYDNEGRVEHAAAAKTCHAMIGDKFVVDVGLNEKTGRIGYCWFEFVTPGQIMKRGEVYKWRREVEPDNIHLFIAEHMPKVYSQLASNIKDRKDNAQNKPETKYWANVERNFRLFTSKLGNDQFQNGVIKQAQYKFRQRGFMDELDAYEDVIGVGNGVLKIGPRPQLLKGYHEYKISKFTETDYAYFDPDNTHVKILLKAFRDIYPEQDVYNFKLLHASTGLDGCESANILLLLVGGGQNGKSFFEKMVHNTLGNMYCASGKSALLTSPIESGDRPNSAQMHMKDKRYFYFDEFNKCELLNTGRVKSIVNPGWQSGRDLCQKQTNFRNTCNPVALSNFDFIIDTTDHGTWRRIYYYRNKVKFCANPNPDNPFEKREDRNFIDRYTNDAEYKKAMLSILVHYNSILHREYNGDVKNVPVPTIMRETEEFRNRQDSLNRYITQMIVKSPGAEPIGMPTLAARYGEWYFKFHKQAAPTINDIQSQFENSRIASALERRSVDIIFLTGHRIRASLEEPLMDNEVELIARAPKCFADVVVLPTPQIVKQKNKESFFDNLVINAPTYIQTREAKTEEIKETDIDLDELLNIL